MLTTLTTFATIGLQSQRVTVEVGTARGEDKMVIVGLGDTAVKESKQRVWMALRSSGFRLPSGRTITINLAPASIHKTGPRFDLAIALGLLTACDVISIPGEKLNAMAFLGELALDGSVRHVSGVLPAAISCKNQGIRTLVVPESDGPEAAAVSGIAIVSIRNLGELIAILNGESEPRPVVRSRESPPGRADVDLADIRGQAVGKRAMEIAAAGGHNVLLSGPPGAGKTLLAKSLQGILPPLTEEESIEVTQIYSVANMLPPESPLIRLRPFRAVHHTASGASIVGGGKTPHPGEISLAHRGILFMDELAEFPTTVLEVLRQPLEERTITIARASGSVMFPADFTLVAAMNPPEYAGPSARKAARKISGPLMDRIDLIVSVDAVPIDELQHAPGSANALSDTIRARVIAARTMQARRFPETPSAVNAAMGIRDVDRLCRLDDRCKQLLRQAADRMHLSARGYHRTIKIARTIADLASRESICIEHVAEALQYRAKIDED